MSGDEPVAAIRQAVREMLVRFADERGDVVALERVEPDTATHRVWRLRPRRRHAATVIWDETGTDDWSAKMLLGAGTDVHVLIDHRLPATAAAETVASIVAAVAEGRFREDLWIARRSGTVAAAIGWIQDPVDTRWRAIGDRSRPLPVLRTLRYRHRIRDYAAYDPPLWERLLDALHERGGTYFDRNEADCARRWVATPEGEDLARAYLRTDLAAARERDLRGRIEAAIRT